MAMHASKGSFRAVLLCGAAFSVTPLMSSAAMAAENDPGAIDEIVVTATKREESVQKVAASVTAVSGEALSEKNVTNVMRLDSLVPGLNLGSSGNDARPALRGVRTEAVLVTQDPAVAFYVDDVYRSRTSQAMAAFVDVNRAEVLRGPQGTLFGRNAFGGAVNIISNAPDAKEFDYAANVSFGRFNTIRTEDMVNIPFGDGKGALRLAGMAEHGGDKIQNDFADGNGFRDTNTVYLRARLKYNFSDAVALDLTGSYWRDKSNGSGDFGYFAPGVPTDGAGNPAAFGTNLRRTINTVNITGTPIGPTVPADTDPFHITRDFNPSQNVKEYSVRGALTADLGFADLKTVFSYTDFTRKIRTDGDFSIYPIAEDAEFDHAVTKTQEVQLVSHKSDKFEWVAGAFFLQDKSRGNFIFDLLYGISPSTGLPNLGQPQPARLGGDYYDYADDSIVKTDSIAFYGQASYYVSPALRLTGGVRYTRDSKTFAGTDNFISGGFIQDMPAVNLFDPDVVFRSSPYRKGNGVFKKVTWLADVSYFVDDSTMLYGKVTTGFQSGGFNTSPSPVDGSFSFDPQTVTAYEMGLKTTFLDRRLRLNVSAFRNDYKDLLAQSFASVGGVLVAVQDNAGRARSQGVEVELVAAPTPDLRLSLTGSYNDAKYHDFVVSGGGYADTFVNKTLYANSGQFVPVSASNPNRISLINLDGKQVQMNPKFSLGVGVANDFQLIGGGGTITPSVNLFYSSSYFTNDRNRPVDRQGSYARLDLRIGWKSESGRFGVEVFGQNVTNKRILTRSVDFPGFQVIQNFQDPATWGVRLSIRR